MSEEREGDYRAVPHPDAVGRWAKGTLYEWVVCPSCGKEYQREVVLEELRDSMFKACKICSMAWSEEQDMCPEGILGRGFASACRLPFKHEGRCEPYDTAKMIASQLPTYFP